MRGIYIDECLNIEITSEVNQTSSNKIIETLLIDVQKKVSNIFFFSNTGLLIYRDMLKRKISNILCNKDFKKILHIRLFFMVISSASS